MSGPALIAYDGSSSAEHAIRAAAERLRSDAAVVLTVWETIVFAGPMGFANPYVDPGVERAHAEHAAELAQRGAVLARDAGFASAESRAEHAAGAAWATILDVAREIDASAIVLGARGLSPVKSALLGSVSHAVAQHADRPVLIVPPPEG